MITHLEAIEARITAVFGPRTPTIVVADATGLTPPYIVLRTATPSRDRDRVIAGAMGAFEAYVDIGCAAATARMAIDLNQQATEALTPGFEPAELPGVAGRYVIISHLDSRDVETNRTVTSTGTDTHPAWALSRFIIRSKPLGGPHG